MVRLCKDCIYYEPRIVTSCMSPSNGINLTDGSVVFRSARSVRLSEVLCGTDANWFKEKPKESVTDQLETSFFATIRSWFMDKE